MKFNQLNLQPQLQAGLEKINFEECTPIQEAGLPPVLEGRDIAGLAQTGTGKTGAFLIPLIERVLISQAVNSDKNEVEITDANRARVFPDWKVSNYILILVPTRELAEQVHANVEAFQETTGIKSVKIYGGTSYDKQKEALTSGVQFVVATPGRLIDLYKEHFIDLRQVRAVVFDEADRMFDMGFKDDMKYILKRIPKERQFLVFSATLNFDVLNVAYEFGADPVEINISKDQPKAEHVKDEIFHVGNVDKPAHLLSLLKKQEPRQCIIFSNFKMQVERLTKFMNKNGIPAMGISSLLNQGQRNRVMEQFKSENDRNILVATDLAARGLDILGVDLIINYELPDDPENYVHRIGRTGRAGREGSAFSLVGEKDVDALGRIEEFLGHKVVIGWMDDEDLITKFESFPRDDEFRNKSSNSGGYKGNRRPNRNAPNTPNARNKNYKPRDRKVYSKNKPRDSEKSNETREVSSPSSEKPNESREVSSPSSENTNKSTHRDRLSGRHKSTHNKKTTTQNTHRSKNRNQNYNKNKSNKRRVYNRSSRKQEPTQTKTSIGQKIGGFLKRILGGD